DGPLRHRAGIRDHDLARALLHLLLAGPRAAGGGRRAGGERERRRRRKRVEHTLSGRVKSRSVNSSSLKILLLALAAACGSSSSQPAGQTTGTGGTTGGGQQATPIATPPGNPRADLIPRKVLFGNPERASVQISPDGKMLSWLAPVDGVMNVWVAPVGKLDQAKPVTGHKTRPVRVYLWAYDGKHILYQQDSGGDENWHVFSVPVAGGEARDLTPMDKVSARLMALSHRVPKKVMIGINDRNPQLHDIYEVDIATGEKKLVVENPGFISFTLDDDLMVRLDR